MNARHRRTLAQVFTEPTLASIEWTSIEAMLVALGAMVEERAGSRVLVALNGVARVFHRPHPGKEAPRPMVRNVRALLREGGIEG
jgi:hypothetical protein